jgi:homoserine O-acetyltransferase
LPPPLSGPVSNFGSTGVDHVHSLATIAAVIAFAVPGALLLWVYLPGRITQVRNLTAATQVLSGRATADQRRALAMRAALALPYGQLVRFTRDPLGDLAAERHDGLIAAALDDAGIDRAHAVIGASYGGMVALAFAERYPDKLERLIVIGAAHRPHPLTTAHRVIQRRIVELGLETGRGRDALVLARELAMTTYRSAREFAQRFSSPDDVESYLKHHGEKFAARFTPERFLALSLSGDLHAVDPSRIHTPTVLIAAEGDTNVPREQTEELARLLGGPSRIVDLPSIHGHDAFLTEPDALGRILESSLS